MTQTAELTASDASANSNFGDAVAIDGITVIVGADNQTVQNQSSVGEAYVYVKPDSGWVDATQTATLLPSNANCSSIGCAFGASVAVSGNTVVVGAPQRYGRCQGIGQR